MGFLVNFFKSYGIIEKKTHFNYGFTCQIFLKLWDY